MKNVLKHFLSPDQIREFLNFFTLPDVSLGQLCALFDEFGIPNGEEDFILALETELGVDHDDAVGLVECLKKVGIDFVPPI